jgi:hypothetical protein
VIFGLEENQVQTLAYSRITNTKASTPATLNPAGTTGEQDYSRIESTPANGFRVAFLADAADTSVRLYTRAIDSRNKVGNALLAKIASAASGNWITDVSLGVDKNGQASIAWIEGTEVRFVRVTTKGKLAGAAQLNVSQTPSEGSLGLVTTAAGATSVVWTTPGATPATSSHDAYIEGRRISSAGVIGDLTRLADAPDGFGWLATRAGASAASNGTVTVVINGFHRGDSAATSFHGVFLVRWS